MKKIKKYINAVVACVLFTMLTFVSACGNQVSTSQTTSDSSSATINTADHTRVDTATHALDTMNPNKPISDTNPMVK